MAVLYYELVGDRLDPYQITPFDEYLAVTQYLKKKVFNGVNTLEKQLLLGELSPMIEQQDGRLQVSRKHAYSTIKQHPVAYNDLLNSGLLHETNGDLDVRQQTVVQFQSDTIANYFIALELFNTHKASIEIINAISTSPFDARAKTEQLKWLLLFQIESADLQLANQLGHITLLGDDTFDIITFICGGLYHLAKGNETMREKINVRLQGAAFLDFTLRYVSFQSDFEPNLEWLLYFDLTEAHQIMIRSKLATVALLKWDEEALLKQLELLAAILHEAYASFAINPLLLLSYLYQRYRGGSIDPQIIRELNVLCYRLPLAKRLAAPFDIDVLLFLYIKASGDKTVTSSYLEFIVGRSQRVVSNNQFEIDMEKLIRAFYLWENAEEDAALECVKHLSINTHKNANYQLIYIIFQLQTNNFAADQHIPEMSQRGIALCEARGFKLIEAYCRILILEQVPKEERLNHINHLKIQFAAYGYNAGSGALSRRYG